MKKKLFITILSLFYVFNCFSYKYSLTVVFKDGIFFSETVLAGGFYIDEQFIPITLSQPNVTLPDMAYVYDIHIESNDIDKFILKLTEMGYFEYILLHEPAHTTNINTLKDENIKIYPNPFIDNIFIIANNGGNIEIIDVSGRVIYSSGLSNGINKISTSHFLKGIYFLKIQNKNNSIQIFKIVKS